MSHQLIGEVFLKRQEHKYVGGRTATGFVPDGFTTCEVRVAVDVDALARQFIAKALKTKRKTCTLAAGSVVISCVNIRRRPEPDAEPTPAGE